MESRRLSWPLRFCIGFLVVAGALFASAYIILNRHNWEPLRSPASLAEGRRGPFSFRTDLDTDYLINIDVERKIESQKLDCMLGMSIFPERCHGLPSLVDISWRVTGYGKTIAEGNSTNYKGSGWGPTVQREIGRFRAAKGSAYTLDLVVNKDAGSLNVANPKIVVAVHPEEYKGYWVIAQLIGMVAILFALIGLAFGAYAAGRALLHR
jgi:hypothetical protein